MWLTRFSRLNSMALEGHAAGYGSTSSESAVLGALLLGGPVLNPSDLTKLVVQSPGGLTKTLRRLEDAGHIRRRPDPGDRRALLVVLTEKGRRAAERAEVELDSYYDNLLADVSAPERAELTVLLRKVLDRLEVHTNMTRSSWPPLRS
jgi:MarR family transcriptional regulator, organic hydroperoxide resistance regulator